VITEFIAGSVATDNYVFGQRASKTSAFKKAPIIVDDRDSTLTVWTQQGTALQSLQLSISCVVAEDDESLCDETGRVAWTAG
jgi:CDP-diacylglycerol pyrophosphatase